MATRRKPTRPRRAGLVPALRDAVAVVDAALKALKGTRAHKPRAKRRKS